MKQTSMSFLNNYRKEFGAALLVGRRKERRPLSTKHPIHLVLRSELSGIFNPGNRSLENLIRSKAKKFGIKVYDLALNWSHIHVVIRIRNRESDNAFIRALTGTIARKIQISQGQVRKIFALRPFTRILNWGRDFKQVLQYQIINQMEAYGLFHRQKKFPPSKKLKSRSKTLVV
jgi:REP element-mobilizing transposase RayT